MTHNNITTPSFRELNDSFYQNVHKRSIKKLFLIIKCDKQRENFVIDNSNLLFNDNENIFKNTSNKKHGKEDVKYYF